MIIFVFTQETENRLWQQWLTLYPNMNKENFISFERFKFQVMPREEKKREEILKEMLPIIQACKEQINGNI